MVIEGCLNTIHFPSGRSSRYTDENLFPLYSILAMEIKRTFKGKLISLFQLIPIFILELISSTSYIKIIIYKLLLYLQFIYYSLTNVTQKLHGASSQLSKSYKYSYTNNPFYFHLFQLFTFIPKFKSLQ